MAAHNQGHLELLPERTGESTNIARCQNENQATEAIEEAEVRCVATIRKVEAMVKEAETHHEIVIKEAGVHHATQAYN